MQNSTLNNEPGLFLRITQGDADAFRQVYLYYFRKLQPFVLRFAKDEMIAEEIVQETFTRLWQKRNDFTETIYLGAWLYKVSANLTFKHLERLAREKKLLSAYLRQHPRDSSITLNTLDFRERKALLEKALLELPPQRLKIYRLSRQDGLSHREIADELHLSPNTVKNQLVKALQHIERFMKTALLLFFAFL